MMSVSKLIKNKMSTFSNIRNLAIIQNSKNKILIQINRNEKENNVILWCFVKIYGKF